MKVNDQTELDWSKANVWPAEVKLAARSALEKAETELTALLPLAANPVQSARLARAIEACVEFRNLYANWTRPR
jgi:hypothetical protein